MLLHILKLPPLHFLLCVYAMKLIESYFPQAPMLSPGLSTIIWLSYFITGLFIILFAALHFLQFRTNIEAFKEPQKLITTGIFSKSRNPIYLGALLMMVGFAFYFNILSSFIFPPIFFLLANRWYIPHEENDAERLFGEKYQAYKKRVRRWL